MLLGGPGGDLQCSKGCGSTKQQAARKRCSKMGPVLSHGGTCMASQGSIHSTCCHACPRLENQDGWLKAMGPLLCVNKGSMVSGHVCHHKNEGLIWILQSATCLWWQSN